MDLNSKKIIQYQKKIKKKAKILIIMIISKILVRLIIIIK